MPDFLIELYVSRTNGTALARHAERARAAAEQLTREGTPVLFLDSIFVPEDETCFYLYRAASPDGVRDAARLADLTFERLSEVVWKRTTPRDERDERDLGSVTRRTEWNARRDSGVGGPTHHIVLRRKGARHG